MTPNQQRQSTEREITRLCTEIQFNK